VLKNALWREVRVVIKSQLRVAAQKPFFTGAMLKNPSMPIVAVGGAPTIYVSFRGGKTSTCATTSVTDCALAGKRGKDSTRSSAVYSGILFNFWDRELCNARRADRRHYSRRASPHDEKKVPDAALERRFDFCVSLLPSFAPGAVKEKS
jgi:hypothetical protein